MAAPTPPRPRPMRIRTFLVVVLTLSGLTAAAVMTSVAIAAQHAQRDSLATQAGELAASKAGDIAIVLRSDERAIRLAAAQLPTTDPADPTGDGACAHLLDDLSPIGPGPFTVVGPDLAVRCSTRPGATIDPSARAWLEPALRSTAATITPSLVADAVTGQPAVQLGVPVTLPGGGAALVVSPIDQATFSSRRPVPGSPSGSAVAVTSSNGVVVGAWPTGLVTVGSTDGGSGWARGPWRQGSSFVPGPDWDVTVGVASNLADQPLVELRTDLLVLLLGFGAIILATLWQVDRWLARPVRAMAALAEHAVQGGRVTAERAEPGGGREGAELAHGLNALLDATSESLDDAHAVVGELTRVREAEKRSLAVALHDNAIQALIATEWTLDRVIAEGGANPLLAEARDTLGQAVVGLRRQTFDLMPPAMATTGLVGAIAQSLDHLWADHGLAGELDADLPGRPVPTTEVLAFRTTQEALRNVARHAAARRVEVTVRLDPTCTCDHPLGCLVVRVHDDGRGVDPATLDARVVDGHLGVLSMQETVRLAGGRFSIGPDPTGGTTVEVHLPWEPAAGTELPSGIPDELSAEPQRERRGEPQGEPRTGGPDADRPPVVGPQANRSSR
ncbi:MAG: sensor histidine kinase [Acidimicrobiales bacterium]